MYRQLHLQSAWLEGNRRGSEGGRAPSRVGSTCQMLAPPLAPVWLPPCGRAQALRESGRSDELAGCHGEELVTWPGRCSRLFDVTDQKGGERRRRRREADRSVVKEKRQPSPSPASPRPGTQVLGCWLLGALKCLVLLKRCPQMERTTTTSSRITAPSSLSGNIQCEGSVPTGNPLSFLSHHPVCEFGRARCVCVVDTHTNTHTPLLTPWRIAAVSGGKEQGCRTLHNKNSGAPKPN